ncbi:hypothetical protein BDV18DRAFT_45620 [Aspergillus unguis]
MKLRWRLREMNSWWSYVSHRRKDYLFIFLQSILVLVTTVENNSSPEFLDPTLRSRLTVPQFTRWVCQSVSRPRSHCSLESCSHCSQRPTWKTSFF